MMLNRNGHWYAIELPVPMLIVLVPFLFLAFCSALSALGQLLR